jgi:nonsense-mediated mRNA decay protein 3
MFCVDCGEEKTIFRNGSCLECYLKNHQFTQGPDFIDITMCVHCGSLKFKSLWTNEPLETIVKRNVKQLFSISNELRQVTIEATCTQEQERYSCTISISGTVDDVPITETHHVYVRMKQHSCDTCSKQFGGYHEAILQIRPHEKKIPKDELLEIRTFVESLIFSMQEQGHRNLFIADVGEEHGGIDFYLSDKQAAATIIKKIQESYGGVMTTSSKNMGMKDGKQLYRVTHLVRLPSYHQGDFLEINEQHYYVLSLSHHTVHVVNLATWEKKGMPSKDLGTVKIVGSKELLKEMIFISQTSQDIQLMDPKNYKMFTLKKPKPFSFENEKIQVVSLDEDMYYLFPVEKQK